MVINGQGSTRRRCIREMLRVSCSRPIRRIQAGRGERQGLPIFQSYLSSRASPSKKARVDIRK